MAITSQAGFIAYSLGERLTQGDAYVFDRVVIVDVSVSVAVDVQIDQAVAGDLVKHVVEERHAGVDGLAARAVNVDGNANSRLVGVAGDFGSTHAKDYGSQKGRRRYAAPVALRFLGGQYLLYPDASRYCALPACACRPSPCASVAAMRPRDWAPW